MSHLPGLRTVRSIFKGLCLLLLTLCSASFFISEVLNIANNNSAHAQIGEEIKDKEVRVIDSDGAQLGIMPPQKALEIANEKNLDLVKIAPMASPPVCKIMNYGKYKFEQEKKIKEAKKNQKIIEIKEIRLSARIDTNDFNTKLDHAIKFIQSGHKVKISCRFRGREMAHTDIGIRNMKKFAECCEEHAVLEKAPKLDGRQAIMFLAPKDGKVK